MGLFTQKQQEPSTWAALPGEPLDRNPNEQLEEAPPVDLLGLGSTASTTIVIPAAPDAEAPGDEAADGSEAGA